MIAKYIVTIILSFTILTTSLMACDINDTKKLIKVKRNKIINQLLLEKEHINKDIKNE